MGGSVGVESTFGAGSTFWIEFPQVGPPNEYSRIKYSSSGAITAEKRWKGTVLYVEDNRPNIDLIQEILEHERPGLRLITCIYGRQAQGLAHEYEPDLILLDLNLPDINGAEVLSLLQSSDRTRNIPVVVITADAVNTRHRPLLSAGATEYLIKPLDIDSFLKVVDSVFKPV